MGCKHNWQVSFIKKGKWCTKCGKQSPGVNIKSNSGSRITIISVVVLVAIIGGYFVFQTYGTPQSVQNEANKLIKNTGNTIQQISSQSQQQISNLQNSISSSVNEDNPVPIAVYDNCDSTIRADLKEINTSCHLPNFQQKNFLFVLPSEIESHMQSSEVILAVSTKVYQYKDNDFKIWLSDQTGGKNYTVNLSQLPTSSGINFPKFKYGASENFVQSTNILTTSVRTTVIPLSYSVVIKDWKGVVMINENFTATESNGLDVQTFDLTGIHKPANLTILVDGGVIYSAYVGSPFAEPQTQP